jgi:hypothetical protein
MSSRTWLALIVLPLAALPLRAQRPDVGVAVAGVRFDEGVSANRSSGTAFGVAARWNRGKFGVRVDVLRASLTPADTGRETFRATLLAGRLSYRIRPAVQLELGITRRSITPALATQDVGTVSLGIRSEGLLAPTAGVWVRGALLPVVRFNGGGSAGTAVEAGFGTWVSLMRGRLRAELDYQLQRIDRSLRGVALPLQTGVTRAALLFRL